MPPAIIGAVVAAGSAWAAAGSIGAVTFFSLTGFQAILGRIAVSLIVSGLTSALSPKQKKADTGAFSNVAQSRTQQIRQAITSRELVYGEVLKSGTVIFATSTSTNKYLHVVIAVADHEVESIDETWIGDDVIPNDYLNADGLVTTGKYANKVRIRKHLGTTGQTADAQLVAEVSEWSTAHNGYGVAYVYIRYERDSALFPNGAPNASFIVRGKKLADSRVGDTLWSANISLMTHDYLTDERFGIEISAGNISDSDTEAAGNACDEIVDTENVDTVISSIALTTNIITLVATNSPLLKYQRGDRVQIVTTGAAPAGLAVATDYYLIPYQFKGTPRIKLAASLDDALAGVAIDITGAGTGTHTIRKTGEPRYFGGGVITTDPTLGGNLRDILSGMAGRVTMTGGYWKQFAGVWRAPTVTLDEGDLRAPMDVATRVTRADRFNAVKGVFVSPLNSWEPSDYPEVKNQSYIDADNGEKMAVDHDLPFTQRAHTAQRIATIKLNMGRQEIVVQHPGNLRGIQFQPLDTLGLNNTRMGWSDKAFEVQKWKLSVSGSDDAPMLGTDMVLQETAAACYDWNSGSEQSVDPAPNTNLPDAFNVAQLSGLSIDSILIRTRELDSTYRVTLGWNEVDNAFVTHNGKIVIQYRKGEDATASPPVPADLPWITAAIVEGGNTFSDVFSGQLGTKYDVRAWAVNSSGVPGNPATLMGIVVGSGAGVTSTLDYQGVADSVVTSLNYNAVTDAVVTTLDYGSVD